jgi:nucleoside-diphosphate-sugar epimerase
VKGGKNWDLLCHHGAFVENYRSIDFDVIGAVQSNSNNLQNVLEQLVASNCSKVILTGSVFEQGEGTGDHPLKAFSPYGLSKGLTSDIFTFWAQHYEIQLSKFVIPNPFGPFEDKRFTAYLIGNWLKGNAAGVNTPDYVRDNIHVSLLAKAYRKFVETIATDDGAKRLNPSGYIESQGAFANRMASEMKPRLGKPCELELAKQEVFDEPRIRVNFDTSYLDSVTWNESEAWDQMAEFYLANRPK